MPVTSLTLVMPILAIERFVFDSICFFHGKFDHNQKTIKLYRDEVRARERAESQLRRQEQMATVRILAFMTSFKDLESL